MSVTVTLDTGHSPDPEYVREVLEAWTEALRVLNHLTMDHAALGEPADADRVIRAAFTVAQRLPQLLAQAARWLEREHEAGRIEVTGGPWAGKPDWALMDLAQKRDTAIERAAGLQEALKFMASVTNDLAAAGTEEDSDG